MISQKNFLKKEPQKKKKKIGAGGGVEIPCQN